MDSGPLQAGQMEGNGVPPPGSSFAPLGAGMAASDMGPLQAGISQGAPGDETNWPLLSAAEEELEDPADKFELLQQLGRGSYGSVFKAIVKQTGEVVAVKMIPLSGADEIEEIQKEIRMLQDCNHPNIVRYLGSWQATEALWIVMEYCGGGSVSDLLQAQNGGLDEDSIAFICAETLVGLAYLHTLGKVHRDIKCGNILLTEAGEVKLADFGVAAQLTNTMSKRNTFIGTPHWMAPEVIQESRYDGKVDVWALGISAMEMAESIPPRWNVHPMRVIFMISRDPPPRLAERERWSLRFHDFVAQSLQKEPKARPSAKYLLQHKFIVGSRGGAAAQSLLPLIVRSRERLQALAASSEKPDPPTPLNIREASADATGKFSWRPGNNYAGPTGTVSASPGGGATPMPARGPWAKTGKARARLAGLSFGAGTHSSNSPKSAMRQSNDSGTMVSRGSFLDSSGTMVVLGDDDDDVDDDSVLEAGGTLVVSPSRLGTGDEDDEPNGAEDGAGGGYLAAVRAAAAANAGEPPSEKERGYMAAVQAFAAERARELDDGAADSAPTPGKPTSTAAGPAAAAAAAGGKGKKKTRGDAEKMLERLRGIVESGAVIPLPYLRAADAAPHALLAHACTLGNDLEPLASPPDIFDMGVGDRPMRGGEWVKTLSELAREGTSFSSQKIEKGQDPAEQVISGVLKRVEGSPVLLNLARTLSYHQRALLERRLSGPEARRIQGVVNDISDTFRMILCL